ncbi:hypothetical protein ACP4OV_021936 [Aristida adscensionis]
MAAHYYAQLQLQRGHTRHTGAGAGGEERLATRKPRVGRRRGEGIGRPQPGRRQPSASAHNEWPAVEIRYRGLSVLRVRRGLHVHVLRGTSDGRIFVLDVAPAAGHAVSIACVGRLHPGDGKSGYPDTRIHAYLLIISECLQHGGFIFSSNLYILVLLRKI